MIKGRHICRNIIYIITLALHLLSYICLFVYRSVYIDPYYDFTIEGDIYLVGAIIMTVLVVLNLVFRDKECRAWRKYRCYPAYTLGIMVFPVIYLPSFMAYLISVTILLISNIYGTIKINKQDAH